MIWKLDKVLGYMYGLDKNSPYADVNGKLYQHHYVMCESIGRALHPDECVHHIDRNKTNNDLSNLQLMTISEHAKLHAIEDRGYSESEKECPECSIVFMKSDRSDQVYCSLECSRKGSRLFEIDREELERLVREYPTTKIAKMFGVSDVAIAKRCKKYSISKPPRGYWSKNKSL